MGRSKLFWVLAASVELVLVFLCIRAASEFKNPPRAIELNLLREGSNNAIVCDVNGDGKDEVLEQSLVGPFPPQNMLRMISPFIPAARLRYKYLFEIPAEGQAAAPVDLEGTGRISIPLLEIKNDSLLLSLYGTNGSLLKTLDFPPFCSPAAPDSNVFQVDFEDLNGDGRREMILTVNSSYSGAPRGLFVYDLQQRRILWRFLCGCSPLAVRMLDLNKDGLKEIILCGWSPHNGMSVNGTDDDHSYLIILDKNGKEINKLVLGGYYTMVYFDVKDINGDGLPEIITAKGSHRGEAASEPGEIRILKAATLETLKYIEEIGIAFSNIYMLETPDAGPVCVVGDSAGRVSTYDGNLNLKKRVTLDYPAIVLAQAPLGKEQWKPCVFVQAGFKQLHIFNSKLDTLQSFTVPAFQEKVAAKILSIRNGSQSGALLLADQLSMISKNDSRALEIWSVATSSFGGLLLLLLLFNGLLLAAGRSRQAHAPAPVNTSNGSWSEVAQEIVHRMKSSLFTIQLEAEKLKTVPPGGTQEEGSSNIARSATSIIEDVADLKGKIRSVMKLLEMRKPETKKVDLADVIGRIVDRYRGLLKGKIEFKLDLDGDVGAIPLDENLMTEALANLIENAIEALPNGGWIRIGMTLIHSPVWRSKKSVEIEVEDNGLGIPSNKLPEIFKPYYSTKKEGAGIGLPIAQRIIAAHGGSIEVQSKEGVGTRFALFLPWKG